MKKLLFFIIIGCITACDGYETDLNDDTEQLKSVQLTNSNQTDSTIILFELESTFLKNGSRSNADLTNIEYSLIDSLLEIQIEEYNTQEELHFSELQTQYPNSDFKKEDFIIDLSQYMRQYVAYYDEKGDKEVWINCFCVVPNNEWREAIFLASDGGNCFFNSTINLNMNKVVSFVVNGNA